MKLLVSSRIYIKHDIMMKDGKIIAMMKETKTVNNLMIKPRDLSPEISASKL